MSNPDQLSPTCCKIVSTTIQCTIDNAEKTTAAVAPGGAQAAIWTLIASSFQTFPQHGMQIANFIPIFGIVQWHVLRKPTRRFGSHELSDDIG
jgi:hypothetical protein